MLLTLLAISLALSLTTCCPEKPTRPPKVEACRQHRLSKPTLGAKRRIPPCVKLRMIRAEKYPPSNVQVMFQALSCKGNQPVTKMKGGDFVVREARIGQKKGRKISRYESQQVILPRKIGSTVYFLLLLDMSGSVQKAPGGIQRLKKNAKQIVGGMYRNQVIAIAVFDGSEDIHQIADYTRVRA